MPVLFTYIVSSVVSDMSVGTGQTCWIQLLLCLLLFTYIVSSVVSDMSVVTGQVCWIQILLCLVLFTYFVSSVVSEVSGNWSGILDSITSIPCVVHLLCEFSSQ